MKESTKTEAETEAESIEAAREHGLDPLALLRCYNWYASRAAETSAYYRARAAKRS